MRESWTFLFRELRRRRVFRVASFYVVGSWLAVQVVSELNDPLKIPDWVDTAVVLILVLGFPIVLILGWILDLTPSGLRVTGPGPEGPVPPRVKAMATLIWASVLSVSVLLASLIIDRIEPEPDPFQGLVDVSKPVPGFSGRAAIAVLPFLNHSDDREQDYFADGFTEDLITALQSIQSFPVIARTSTFQYKNHDHSAQEIAAELGAGYIVEGSIRKVGQDVRINARVVKDDAKQIWADSYTYEFNEVLKIQDRVVANIIHAIEPELILTEADRSRFVRTEDMEAWDYYLQALTNTYAPFAFTDLNGRYVPPERLDLARTLLFEAIDLDPHFASAYRLLNHVEGAFAFNLSHLLDPEQSAEKIRLALEYGERARLISPFEPAVCSCQAAMLLMSGDVENAFRLQRESLRYNPSNAVAHAMMGKILQVKGRYEKALEEIAIAKRLSPRSMAMTTFLYFEAATQLAMGQFDHAIDTADRSLLLVPGNYDALYIRILALAATDRIEEARSDVVSLRKLIPEASTPSSGWTESFPEAVASRVRFASSDNLHTQSFNEGLAVVLRALGW